MEVIIQSDRIGTGPYIVHMSRKGAHRCSCPARKRCKHMERAELRPAFQAAARTLLQAKRFSSKPAFLEAFESLVDEFEAGRKVADGGNAHPVNAAIREVIRQAEALQVKPTCRRGGSGECDRCGGTGHLPQFNHVQGGRCFRCRGMSGEKKLTPKAKASTKASTKAPRKAQKPKTRKEFVEAVQELTDTLWGDLDDPMQRDIF